MSPLPGDPASLSACAGALGSSGRRLAVQAAGLREALAELGRAWPGRSSVALRRRGEALARATAATAGELDRLTVVLQDQATDLAGLLADARRIQGRAAAAGLEIRDGTLVPSYGLAPADAALEQSRAATAATLQTALDLVLAQHRRRRDFVLGALQESGARLAATSSDLRNG